MRASPSSSPAALATERLAALTANYRPLPNVPDEFVDRDGRPRDHWLRFLESLFALGADDIERRFATADRHIRDTGVSYRAYGDTSERAWPLSHLPLLIEIGGMAGDRDRRRAARAAHGSRALRHLWRRHVDHGRRFAGRRGDGLGGFSAPRRRSETARRKISPFLRRRSRPRTGWTLVGAGRSRASALRRGLCARQSPGDVARLSGALSRHEHRAACALLPSFSSRPHRHGLALRSAHLPADARPLQRNLFRTGLSRPLSRLPSGRRRRSHHARRRNPCPHHCRAQARRCHLAAHRFRFCRSARTQRAIAAWRAGPRRSLAQRRRRARECVGLGRSRSPGSVEFSAAALPDACSAKICACRMSRPGGAGRKTNKRMSSPTSIAWRSSALTAIQCSTIPPISR